MPYCYGRISIIDANVFVSSGQAIWVANTAIILKYRIADSH